MKWVTLGERGAVGVFRGLSACLSERTSCPCIPRAVRAADGLDHLEVVVVVEEPTRDGDVGARRRSAVAIIRMLGKYERLSTKGLVELMRDLSTGGNTAAGGGDHARAACWHVIQDGRGRGRGERGVVRRPSNVTFFFFFFGGGYGGGGRSTIELSRGGFFLHRSWKEGGARGRVHGECARVAKGMKNAPAPRC